MCLYPKTLPNQKYMKRGIPHEQAWDVRLHYITAKCGICYECRKQKQSEWLVRMEAELNDNNGRAAFIGLSFSDESLNEIQEKYNTDRYNEAATKAVRLWLERVRKKTGKSVRHWLITERGQKNTERIHLHGILFGLNYKEAKELLECTWKYGKYFVGNKGCGEKGIRYMTKYMLKYDEKHPEFKGKILTSKGIGASAVDSWNVKNRNYYNGAKTNEKYLLKDSYKEVMMPSYYRKKIWTDDQREMMLIRKMNDGWIYILGDKVQVDNYEGYIRLLEEKQAYGTMMLRRDVSEELKAKQWIREADIRSVNKWKGALKIDLETDVWKKTELMIESREDVECPF